MSDLVIIYGPRSLRRTPVLFWARRGPAWWAAVWSDGKRLHPHARLPTRRGAPLPPSQREWARRSTRKFGSARGPPNQSTHRSTIKHEMAGYRCHE